MEMKIDPVQLWLDAVGKRSHNESTQYKYRKCLDEFLTYIVGNRLNK